MYVFEKRLKKLKIYIDDKVIYNKGKNWSLNEIEKSIKEENIEKFYWKERREFVDWKGMYIMY